MGRSRDRRKQMADMGRSRDRSRRHRDRHKKRRRCASQDRVDALVRALAEETKRRYDAEQSRKRHIQAEEIARKAQKLAERQLDEKRKELSKVRDLHVFEQKKAALAKVQTDQLRGRVGDLTHFYRKASQSSTQLDLISDDSDDENAKVFVKKELPDSSSSESESGGDSEESFSSNEDDAKACCKASSCRTAVGVALHSKRQTHSTTVRHSQGPRR
jgi:hypothetical protein